MTRRFLLPLTLSLAAFVLSPLPGSSAPLSERIEGKRRQVETAKRKEGVLTETIAGYSTRIGRLEGELRSARATLARTQRSLDAKREALLRVRDRLEVARDRLERLRRELATARQVLAARLVELYKADMPDAVTVVLQADGFGDLLERAEFFDRVADQDRAVTERVRRLRTVAREHARELAKLEGEAQLAAERVLRERDAVAATANQLASSRAELKGARGDRRAALASVRRRRHAAQEDLVALEREQARVQAALASPPASGVPAPPPAAGSGEFIWPVSGTLTSPFGQRWGRLHAGIDIAAPEGTPIYAAASGTVALAAWTGGYGIYTCIQHGGGLSTCYAHQSRFGTSAGAAVRQGQVIGYVGNTGNSFGAHVHFEVRSGGLPVDPLAYL